MPNYCENDLRIIGDGKEAFLEHAKGTPYGKPVLFDFNKFIPYPQKYIDQDAAVEAERKAWREQPEATRGPCPRTKDGFNSGGYEWCIANWGTKWNAGDVRLGDHDDYEAYLHFSTAWGPPSPVIVAASDMFPNLDFELVYYEKGMQFHGILRCKAGEVLEDWRGKYVGNRGG